MTNSLAIQQLLNEHIQAHPGTFRTTQEWMESLGMDEPKGKVRLCLEHLCNAGLAQRQLKMGRRNVPIVLYGWRTGA